MKKLRYRPGDIVKIPLPKGHFTYGRLYRDSTIAIYLRRFESAPDPTFFEKKPDLVAGVFTTHFRRWGWIICAHHPFRSEEEEWAPPVHNRDIIDPSKVQIYYRGELRPASESEIAGLDEQLMYKPNQLADEISRRIDLTQCE